MGNRQKYQVFVSHSTTDKWIAVTICEKIEVVGASTFRDDRDINGGDNIPEALRTAIRASNEMLVLLTPASVNRPWVLLEIGAAWERGIRIVPIRYQVEVNAIPAILKDTKAIDLNEIDRYLTDLRLRAKRKKRS